NYPDTGGTPCLLAAPPSTRSTTLYRLLPSTSVVVSITLNLACMGAFCADIGDLQVPAKGNDFNNGTGLS
ncbi:hypothetical protein, partial [Pseudomonas sp. GM21]|uniref:hypothetical protein n=1 Tax=Pseudomonas sp. GM21 TaxID=1144325 RepID=UPI001EE666DD